MAQRRMVIVGGGVAAAKAAETLRAEGFPGPVLLVSEEAEVPYERPPLSKGFLHGEVESDALAVHHLDWYDAQGVELELGTRAAEVDLAHRTVALSNGRRVGFDKLLLATGARPRRLDLPGSSASGIFYLRTVRDAESLRAALEQEPRRVVVVGAGWIGLETAAAARMRGHHVTVLDPQPTPLHTVLGAELGTVFAALHRDHDVELRMRTGLCGFQAIDGDVSGVITDAGDVLPADAVVVGVGVAPALELAAGAGLTIDNGVVTDSTMRTSHPDVFAAGDIANAYNPLLGKRLRVEHWENARTSAAVAARSMLGRDAVHDAVPFFFSDQFDLGMEYSGHAVPGGYDQVVIRGDVATRTFIAFWTSAGRVVAGMNVNVWDVTEPIQRLIRGGRRVDLAQLADPGLPLEQVAAGGLGAA